MSVRPFALLAAALLLPPLVAADHGVPTDPYLPSWSSYSDDLLHPVWQGPGIVEAGGRVFVLADDVGSMTVRAHDAITGSVEWTADVSFGGHSAAMGLAAADDGSVVHVVGSLLTGGAAIIGVATLDGADGRVLDTQTVGLVQPSSAVFVAAQGRLLVAGRTSSGDVAVAAVQPMVNGTVWTRILDFDGSSSPRTLLVQGGALYVAGTVYTRSMAPFLVALDPSDGALLWQTQLPGSGIAAIERLVASPNTTRILAHGSTPWPAYDNLVMAIDVTTQSVAWSRVVPFYYVEGFAVNAPQEAIHLTGMGPQTSYKPLVVTLDEATGGERWNRTLTYNGTRGLHVAGGGASVLVVAADIVGGDFDLVLAMLDAANGRDETQAQPVRVAGSDEYPVASTMSGDGGQLFALASQTERQGDEWTYRLGVQAFQQEPVTYVGGAAQAQLRPLPALPPLLERPN